MSALPLSQDDIKMSGHAIEARLCAEDPSKGFLPSTGPIVASKRRSWKVCASMPAWKQGSVISPFYNSMIAKLIASAVPIAVRRSRALRRRSRKPLVAGPKTNASFLHALTVHPAFAAGRMDTGLIARELATLAPAETDARAIAFRRHASALARA